MINVNSTGTQLRSRSLSPHFLQKVPALPGRRAGVRAGPVEMASLLDEPPPTANLLVELQPGVSLQMCFMRPDARDVCPELPYLLPIPEAGLPAGNISAGDVLHGLMETPAATSSTVVEQAATLRALERALAHDLPLPPLDRVVWHQETFVSQEGRALPFADLSANQLMRLVDAVHSQPLCDALLFHHFPRLLRGSERTEGAVDGLLPAPLAELLLLLLRGGTSLRLSAADFEQQVSRPLHGTSRMGAVAAAQASLVFVSSSNVAAQGELS